MKHPPQDRHFFAFAVLATLSSIAACQGGAAENMRPESTSNAIAVNVDSENFSLAHAVYFNITDPNAGGLRGTLIYVSERADICDQLQNGWHAKSEKVMTMFLNGPDEETSDGYRIPVPASGPGTFTIGVDDDDTTHNHGEVEFMALDQNCKDTLEVYGVDDDLEPGKAKSGSVTVTQYQAIANGTLVGNFSISMSKQSAPVTGSFDAIFCPIDIEAALHGPAPTCK